MAFVHHVRDQMLAGSSGRMVKSLGDGLLLEFASVEEAVALALTLQPTLTGLSAGSREPLLIRTGLHVADVLVADFDVLGSGVNLAARLAGLAAPGEVVVSAEVRESITDGLDAEVTDLGECYLKHFDGSVRAFRLAPPHTNPPLMQAPSQEAELRVAIAVIPFSSFVSGEVGAWAVGDAIADSINGCLARVPGLRVISRLSTSALRSADRSASECRAYLGATYVLAGQFHVSEHRVQLLAQLSNTRDGSVLWSSRYEIELAAMFSGDDPALADLVLDIVRVIATAETRRARGLPLPSLESFSLYLAGVTLLHRLRQMDFARARGLLEALQERQPRQPAPLAMLGKWHLLRLLQGWAEDPLREVQQARDCTRRALDLEPEDATSLAVEALLTSHAEGDLNTAESLATAAIAADPQETMGWLALAGVCSYRADGAAALQCARRAAELSPLDPQRFMFDLMLAAGELASARPDAAVMLVKASLRQNALHAPAHRVHVISLAVAGRHIEARKAALELLRVDPSFSLGMFNARYPGRSHPHADEYLRALRSAGIPP
jgi:TolB-like protein